MNIYVCIVGELMTNCYLIENEKTHETVIVDPGASAHKIAGTLMNKGLHPVAILLTHAHNDHFDGVEGLRERYGELPVYIGELETDLLADGTLNNPFGDSEGLTADHTVSDGQILELAGLTMKVIHTPGHTAGSVCYYFEQDKILVAGDTLFFRSYGRTDLATGSDRDMFDSLAKLLTGLPEDVQVLPGHGRTTTIGYEKAVKGFE